MNDLGIKSKAKGFNGITEAFVGVSVAPLLDC
jgi:hypothetical protein